MPIGEMPSPRCLNCRATINVCPARRIHPLPAEMRIGAEAASNVDTPKVAINRGFQDVPRKALTVRYTAVRAEEDRTPACRSARLFFDHEHDLPFGLPGDINFVAGFLNQIRDVDHRQWIGAKDFQNVTGFEAL
jgi:hypothetical protein